MDISDRYWVSNKFDYNYEGKTYEERIAWREQEDKDWIRPEIPPEKPQIGVYPPNEAFYKLSKKEAQTMAEATQKALMQNWEQNQ